MTMTPFEKIWIHEDSWESEVAFRFRMLFPYLIEKCDTDPLPARSGHLTASEFDRSKKIVYIKRFEGHFFKRCPGATQKKTLTCCNYHVLNLGQQCNMNCSYCYLQSYLNTPYMIIYSNIDQALDELKAMAEQFPNMPFRVGTGEVIDSLSLDPYTHYSRKLIEFFSQYPKWTLEFKTKSAEVDQFLDVSHSKNVVVSWSINAKAVIENEEHGTARLHQRLEAARKCADKGYQVAFHIDPLIWYPEWKSGYEELIDLLSSQFKSHEVHVVSLGALRFQPEQRHMMRQRFGMQSWVVQAEMFPSEGHKLRYDQTLRSEMFQFVLGQFKQKAADWKVFLCMETPETWIQNYSSTPMKVEGLHDFFRPLPKIHSEP